MTTENLSTQVNADAWTGITKEEYETVLGSTYCLHVTGKRDNPLSSEQFISSASDVFNDRGSPMYFSGRILRNPDRYQARIMTLEDYRSGKFALNPSTQVNADSWVRITEEEYERVLGSTYCTYQTPKQFLCSSPSIFNDQGNPLYFAGRVLTNPDRHQARYLTREEFKILEGLTAPSEPSAKINSDSWTSITEEKYHDMLEVLPPIDMTNTKFISSECYDCDRNDANRYFVGLILREPTRYQARYLTLADYKTL